VTARFRIFFDMDGVLVDFDGYCIVNGLRPEDTKRREGAYKLMHPIAGAIDGIRKVMSIAGQYGGEVWLATKPPTGIPWAYADKVSWVLEHLPELKRRIIITHDKGMLGGEYDILVDDRPWRANCCAFRGRLIMFGWAEWPRSEPCLKSFDFARDWSALVPSLHDHMRARWALLRDDDPDNAEDINAARGLLRLGPLPIAAGRPVHGGYPDVDPYPQTR
jgi:5'(3')-deoxyribonucleotidase